MQSRLCLPTQAAFDTFLRVYLILNSNQNFKKTLIGVQYEALSDYDVCFV